MRYDRVCRIGICLTLGVIGQPAMAQRDPPKPPMEKAARPIKPASSNPCAAYGAGFARVAGSDTCVKVGGGISVGVGGSR